MSSSRCMGSSGTDGPIRARAFVGFSEKFLGDAAEERVAESLSCVRGHHQGRLRMLAEDGGDGARGEKVLDDDRFGVVDPCCTGSLHEVSLRLDDDSAVRARVITTTCRAGTPSDLGCRSSAFGERGSVEWNNECLRHVNLQFSSTASRNAVRLSISRTMCKPPSTRVMSRVGQKNPRPLTKNSGEPRTLCAFHLPSRR